MERVEEGDFYWVPCQRRIGAYKVRDNRDIIDDGHFQNGTYCATEEEALQLSHKLFKEGRQKD